MSYKLSQEALENIKTYKYKTNGLTFIEIKLFDPFWNLIVKYLPKSLAPNMMTLMGLIFPLISYIVLIIYDWNFTQPIPNWAMFLTAFSLFWY